jgi:hypothetical protein
MTSPCILARNGLFFRTYALIDSGANGFAFIDAAFLNRLSPFLKPVLKRLKTPLRVKGYNGLHGADITHYTLLNLTVDDRIQSFTPFLITRLGTRTVILGRSWLAENRILLNCTQRKLHWPPDLTPTFSYAKNTEMLLRSSDRNPVDRYHQYDTARRDRKLDDYWAKQPSRPLRTIPTSSANLTILRRPASPVQRPSEADYKPQTPATSCTATFKKDTDTALRKMEKDLKSSLPPTPPAPKRRPKPL